MNSSNSNTSNTITETIAARRSYTFSVLVRNEAGVLTRIAGMFSRRGFNIESLAVGGSEQSGLSRMTIVVHADPDEADQIKKQLDKLIDVIEVENLEQTPFVDRELILIRVKAETQNRLEISQIAELFRARIVDVAARSLIIEVTGDQGKLKAIVELLGKFGIELICRTGQIALPRGSKK
ncbi:MAG: acetolactate synthase small subunit [Candidatus Caenarcaniphilales bacterium]|nr:acetolactate synthase small subunit [Candidatus Caenarcaniphilales bacterium]